jgi:hypothetical protein
MIWHGTSGVDLMGLNPSARIPSALRNRESEAAGKT